MDRIGGTVFGGTAPAVKRYHKLYYDMVRTLNEVFERKSQRNPSQIHHQLVSCNYNKFMICVGDGI